MPDAPHTSRLRRRAGMDRLAGMLEALRGLDGLREVRPGVFHLGRRPFLHFHFEPDGTLFADVRLTPAGFDRFDVTHPPGQHDVVGRVAEHLERSAGR